MKNRPTGPYDPATGRVIAASTPFGQRGWWYESWRSTEAWERFRVTAEECPRISPQFLEEERRSLGHWSFQQEYMADFQAGAGAVFDMNMIEACFDDTVQPLGLLDPAVWNH